jgi:hypothetical protein
MAFQRRKPPAIGIKVPVPSKVPAGIERNNGQIVKGLAAADRALPRTVPTLCGTSRTAISEMPRPVIRSARNENYVDQATHGTPLRQLHLESDAAKLYDSDERERLFAAVRERFSEHQDEQMLDALDFIIDRFATLPGTIRTTNGSPSRIIWPSRRRTG